MFAVLLNATIIIIISCQIILYSGISGSYTYYLLASRIIGPYSKNAYIPSNRQHLERKCSSSSVALFTGPTIGIIL